MTKILIAIMTTTACFIGSSVRAAESPPADPDAVGGIYKKILGQLPANVSNAITVTRDGDATKVTFDINQLSQPLTPMGIKINAKPITIIYTPLADGTMRQMVETPADVMIGFDTPGPARQTGAFSYQGMTFDGIYDPKLAFYKTISGSVAKTFGDMSEPATGTNASVLAGKDDVTATAEPDGDGAIKIRETILLDGFVEKIHADPSKASSPTSGPALDVEFKVPQIKGEFNADGWRSFAMRDMALFLLDNRTQPALAAKQVELKRHVRDLVPFFNSVAFNVEAQGVTVQSPFGQGSAGTAAVTMALDTHTPSSSFSFGERAADIKVDSVFMPVWAKSLVPTSFDLEFGVNGFDIAGAMTKFVDVLEKQDLANPKPDTTDYEALGRESIMPNGSIHIDLKSSSIASPIYKISWQGGMDTWTNKDVKGHVDVTATGIDDVIKALIQVRDKGAPEAVIGLYAAKALGKPGPDGALLWAIDLDSHAGTLLVNGKPVGPQKKQAL